jgi:hypothetical protein
LRFIRKTPPVADVGLENYSSRAVGRIFSFKCNVISITRIMPTDCLDKAIKVIV